MNPHFYAWPLALRRMEGCRPPARLPRAACTKASGKAAAELRASDWMAEVQAGQGSPVESAQVHGSSVFFSTINLVPKGGCLCIVLSRGQLQPGLICPNRQLYTFSLESSQAPCLVRHSKPRKTATYISSRQVLCRRRRRRAARRLQTSNGALRG